MDYDCQVVNEEIKTLEQTSLLQSLHRGSYQFHKIIKVFFAKKALASRMNCNDFWKVFFSHYTNLIYSLSSTFNEDYKSSIQTLDTEMHNVHYILEHIKELCFVDSKTSLLFFQTVRFALHTRFLICRFSKSELFQPLIAMRTCLEQMLDNKTLSDVTVMGTLTKLAVEQYVLDESLESLEYVKTLIEKFEGDMTVPGAGDLYHLLGSHFHTIGELEKEKRCHEKILLLANAKLDGCHYGSCDYYHLSWAYYRLGNFKIAAKFAELNIEYKKDSMSVFILIQMLCLLHECQEMIGNHTGARATFDKLLYVLPALNDSNIPEMYTNLKVLSKASSLLRKYGRIEESREIERRQILAVNKINATDKCQDYSLVLQAIELAFTLYDAKEYNETIELAECAFNCCKEMNHINCKILLLQLLAEAKYYTGQKIASVEHFEEAIKYSFSDLNLHYDSAVQTCDFLLSTGTIIHMNCLGLLWMRFKKFVYVNVFADTISADTFSFTSSNDNGKASTDASLSSDHMEFIQPALAILRLFFAALFEPIFQLFTHLFTSIFNISTVVYLINIVFIVFKMFIIFCFIIGCCFCCCCICQPRKYTDIVIRSCLRRIFFN